MRAKQTLYAFWSYDLCPYVLGGIVEKFLADGYIRAKGYTGMKFKPLAILPDEEGKEALLRLKALRQDYDVEEKKLKKKYKNAVRKMIGLEEVE